MPKILSVDSKHEKPSRGNLFRIIWEWILSLDKFTKLYLITILLLTVATPAIISGYLIFTQQAAETSNTIASSVSQAPDNKKPISPKSLTPSTVTTVTIEDYTVDEEIISHLNLLNAYRNQNGLSSLIPSRTLTDVAKWMTNDMASNNYFSHTDSLGRDPFQRMRDFGYTFNTWKGENLAAGYQTGSDVLEGWKGSPGHNANMLGPNYTAVGIYRAYNPNSAYGWYWAQEFGGVIDVPVNYVMPMESDSDSDGFTDSIENYIGTNPNLKCGTDAWPPDFNNDRKVSLPDVLSFSPSFNSIEGDARYNRRHDLNKDGVVSNSDVLKLSPYFNKSCTP